MLQHIRIKTPFCQQISFNPKLAISIQLGQEYPCPTLSIWDSRISTTRQCYFSHIQRNRKQGDTVYRAETPNQPDWALQHNT